MAPSPNTLAPAASPGDLAIPRVLRIIARELAGTVGAEPLSKRSARLLWMIDGLLRHVVVEMEGAGSSNDLPPAGSSAIAAELAGIAERTAIEAALPLAAQTPSQAELFAIEPNDLTRYLRERSVISAEASVSRVERLLGGFSKETFLVDLAGVPGLQGAVLRRDAAFGPVDSSVVDEYPLLVALDRLGYAVARPMLIEADPAIFGAPFLLSARSAGTAPSNTEGLHMKPEHVEAARALAAFLGKLHGQDVAALDLGGRWSDSSLEMRDHIAFEIDAIEASWRDHRKSISPTIAAAIEWLRSNIPDATGERAVVVHGDAGLHNLLMQDGRISVMLDWELAHPGDATEDLAYCRTWVDQVLGWSEFLEIYYRHGGQTYHAERERFYGVLADLRVAVFAVRAIAHVDLSDHPELPIAFAAVYYSRIFRAKVGQRLLEASEAAPHLAAT